MKQISLARGGFDQYGKTTSVRPFWPRCIVLCRGRSCVR